MNVRDKLECLSMASISNLVRYDCKDGQEPTLDLIGKVFQEQTLQLIAKIHKVLKDWTHNCTLKTIFV